MPSTLSVSQVRELDRWTIEEAGVPARLLMEIAGVGAHRVLANSGVPRSPVIVLAGRGNNAGDAYVVARLAAAAGDRVHVLASEPPASLPPGDARANAELLVHYGLEVEPLTVSTLPDHLAGAGVVVDGLLGTGLRGDVRPPYDSLIAAINRSGRPVLALDLPSGLDGDRGEPLGIAVQARWTATFGAMKHGLAKGAGPSLAGEVTLVPLPFVPAAWAAIGQRPE